MLLFKNTQYSIDQFHDVYKKLKPIDHLKTSELIDILSSFDTTTLEKTFYEYLIKENLMSASMAKVACDSFRELFTRDFLTTRLKREITKPYFADEVNPISEYYKRNDLKSMAITLEMMAPLGKVLHITAGNVFLGMIDSWLMGVLTRNTNLVKVSSGLTSLVPLFESKLQSHFKGVNTQASLDLAESFLFFTLSHDEQAITRFLKHQVDAIMTWGGEESTLHWKQDLGLGVRFIEYGPKLSFHLIESKDFSYDDIARDIALWDQSACANSQFIFLDTQKIVPEVFIERLNSALENFPQKRKKLSADEWVEFQKTYRESQTDLFHGGHCNADEVLKLSKLSAYGLIYFSASPELETSLLNRTVIIKQKPKDLRKTLTPVKNYLQTVGLASQNMPARSQELLSLGVQRVCPLGKMLTADIGEAHDGKVGLASLMRVVSTSIDLQSYSQTQIQGKPIIDTEAYREKTEAFLKTNPNHHRAFASGATTGKSKYSFYSQEDFTIVAQCLAHQFKVARIEGPVLNMFVAGNMWSSFLAVDQALARLSVLNLPLGGASIDPDFIQMICQEFNPKTIMGIPSLLESYLDELDIQIDLFLYAGEMLTASQKKKFTQKWGVKRFFSAGYASVDAGVIAYQLPGDDLHYCPFPGVYLEEVAGEIVVSSHLRKDFPTERLKTGDAMEWVDREKQIFKLLGRKDDLVMLWGARIKPSELEQIFSATGQELLQVHIYDDEVLFITDKGVSLPNLLKELANYCEDFKQTVKLWPKNFLVSYQIKDSSSLVLNSRTGKKSFLINHRG